MPGVGKQNRKYGDSFTPCAPASLLRLRTPPSLLFDFSRPCIPSSELELRDDGGEVEGRACDVHPAPRRPAPRRHRCLAGEALEAAPDEAHQLPGHGGVGLLQRTRAEAG